MPSVTEQLGAVNMQIEFMQKVLPKGHASMTKSEFDYQVRCLEGARETLLKLITNGAKAISE